MNLLSSRDRPADMVQALDAGAGDVLTKPCDGVQLRARLRSGERVFTLQENLLRTQAELKHQATHDRLRGLWHRGQVLDELTRELSRVKREKVGLSVAMADLDRFKTSTTRLGTPLETPCRSRSAPACSRCFATVASEPVRDGRSTCA